VHLSPDVSVDRPDWFVSLETCWGCEWNEVVQYSTEDTTTGSRRLGSNLPAFLVGTMMDDLVSKKVRVSFISSPKVKDQVEGWQGEQQTGGSVL
jgi:hypothetical protein